ncbi:DUF7096 domain-containing protein [Haloplanus pelagicus]|uniref:DUF7096 domain-containing protein n=1 Tax=Haloplanus pelagicus TaxID=2949995 RepID=UPI00203DC151|nr:hypothetical protein [Haloplanus sp. HW8-1]
MSPDVPNVVVFAIAVVVVAGAVAVPASALGSPSTPTAADTTTDEVLPQTTDNGSASANESVAPGQQLAGVVGVQGAEIDGEIGERSLSTQLSRAESNASKAAVVATDLNRIRERLVTLRERQERLRQAHRSGELSTGEFRARMAVTSAEVRSVQTQLEANSQVTRDLPDEALGSSGVDRSELDRLREDADELQGPEVAEIARQIAGENPGRELDPERGPGELPEPAQGDEREDETEGPPDDRTPGPPEDPGGGSDANNETATTGPPEEAGDGSGNEGDRGNAENGEDPGNGNGDGEDAGNGEDPGNGNGDGEGAGNGNGNGDGEGAGNGEDPGNGNGDGEGAGNGNGNGGDPGNGNAGGDNGGGNR